MRLAIYKRGQGYWTRMISAVGAGVLVIGGVLWLAGELSAINFRVDRTHQLAISTISLSPPPDDPLKAIGIVRLAEPAENDSTDGSPNPGSRSDAVGVKVKVVNLSSAAAGAGMLKDDLITHANGTLVANRKELVAQFKLPAGTNTIFMTVVRTQSIMMYVQAGVSIVLIVLCGGTLYWLLNKPKIADFMIATESEMRKVHWPTKKEIIGSTWVVISGTVLMAVLLGVADLGFFSFFQLIHIIPGG